MCFHINTQFLMCFASIPNFLTLIILNLASLIDFRLLLGESTDPQQPLPSLPSPSLTATGTDTITATGTDADAEVSTTGESSAAAASAAQQLKSGSLISSAMSSDDVVRIALGPSPIAAAEAAREAARLRAVIAKQKVRARVGVGVMWWYCGLLWLWLPCSIKFLTFSYFCF